jgi:orotidine-5'-phosphate decarboxylase
MTPATPSDPRKPFFERLTALATQRGALCVGIDPHEESLALWGLPFTLAALETFSRGMVAHLADTVAVFKPQSAFFEAFGSPGIAVLERVLADINQAGALSILDVKRGDIGSTMSAYARAYLADDSALASDAITLSPYAGLGALQPAIELAAASGRGVFVLARTSNPEGSRLQNSRDATKVSVAQQIVDEAQCVNDAATSPLVGLVVGATRADIGVDLARFTGWVLAPGIGAQGGRMSELATRFGAATNRVLPSASREIAAAGNDSQAIRARIRQILAT